MFTLIVNLSFVASLVSDINVPPLIVNVSVVVSASIVVDSAFILILLQAF